MKFKFILLLVLPVLLGAQTQKAEQIQNLPNDVKWVTDSEEYTLLCEQIYRSAWISIRSRLMNMDNPVIIMDLDETVLDNSNYQGTLLQWFGSVSINLGGSAIRFFCRSSTRLSAGG